jgi:hypothetical protein
MKWNCASSTSDHGDSSRGDGHRLRLTETVISIEIVGIIIKYFSTEVLI